jgi:hypothetical protein
MVFDGTDGQDLRIGVLDEAYALVFAGPAADQQARGIAVQFAYAFAVPGLGVGRPQTQKEDNDQYICREIPAHFH